MKDGFIKVCAPSIEVKVASVSNNVKTVISKIDECYNNGAQVIVFPELCLCGATAQDLVFQSKLLEDCLDGLEDIAESTTGKKALVCLGMPYKLDNKVYNVCAVINDGNILGIVPKSYLGRDDNRYFSSSNIDNMLIETDDYEFVFGSNVVFKFCDISVGVVFGDEIFNPSGALDDVCYNGANLVVCLSKDNELVNRSNYRKNLIVSETIKNGCGLVFVTSGKGESTQDYVFSGHSMIVEAGEVLDESKPFEYKDIYSEVDIEKICNERIKRGLYKEIDSLYDEVEFDLDEVDVKLTRKYNKLPFVPSGEEEKWARALEVLNIQAYGLKKRLEHVKPKSLVIGLSGGLDSCLALLVMVRAVDLLKMDRKSIIAISMPCFGTTKRTKSNAEVLANALGVSFREIDIKEATSIHLKDIGHDGIKQDVAYENSQARERTQILMDVANMESGLVIGTGDLSELALGWATYNGDHMSMYGVNSNIPKTLVRHLVAYEAKVTKDEVLRKTLLDILATPVSPELLPPKEGEISQVTEDIVGPYELHDFFMYYVIRYGFRPSKIYRIAQYVFDGVYTDEVLKKWLKNFYSRFFSQQFKRSCLTDGPKVGSVGLSPRGDYLMASDSVRDDYLKEVDEL